MRPHLFSLAFVNAAAGFPNSSKREGYIILAFQNNLCTISALVRKGFSAMANAMTNGNISLLYVSLLLLYRTNRITPGVPLGKWQEVSSHEINVLSGGRRDLLQVPHLLSSTANLKGVSQEIVLQVVSE